MPALPTFTVSDAAAQRILNAFKGVTAADGTALTPAQAYKRWLRAQLIQQVKSVEAQTAPDTLETELTI